ncbi:MAG TPA: RodZ domain-containing protein [Rhodocyclaceae bacterium]|nr:RodZ domain-containing protein [Rhodocyclaceae bacterium]
MPGRRLKEAREARSISVAEVAHALKFGVRQVEALEADDYSNLQGATFQRGFIRSYARYLKEDPAPLLALLDVTAPPAEAEIVAPSNMGTATSEPFLQRNQRWVLMLLALVAAAAVGAYWVTQKDGGMPSKVETEATTTQSVASPDAQPTVVAPTPVPLTAPNAAPEGSGAASGTQAPLFPPTPAAPAAPAVPAAAPQAAPAPVAPAAPAAARTPAPTAPAAAVSAAPVAVAPVAAPAPAPKVVIDFDGRSWVEIKDATQRVVFVGEYGAGTHQVVYGKPPFQLWIGKTSAVRVSYNDQKVNLQPHTRDEVARLTLE